MFKTFRPRGSSVKAVQLSLDTADFAADWCAGKKTQRGENPAFPVDYTEDNLCVMVPTLEGGVPLVSGEYLVRTSNGFRVMTAEEFEDRYEPVRATREKTD